MWKKVDDRAAECCRRLWQAGFQAHPVGGCIRDLLLGRTPGDWDIATDARPEQVMELFEHTAPTGVKHGTITVILDGSAVEVTTYRTETGYSDGRHPDAVDFHAGLEEDLARRDFTINAMALDRTGALVDPFGGRGDLAAGVIRCVGDPDRRFSEDGLRMFRAVRFGAQLGFVLEEETWKALVRNAGKAGQIAGERVRAELEKILCSASPERCGQLFSSGLLRPWTDAAASGLENLAFLPAEPLLRWAGLCACMQAGSGCALLGALRSDGRTLRGCIAGEKLFSAALPRSEREWRYALALTGREGCMAAAAMAAAAGQHHVPGQLRAVLAADPCIRTGQLALSGGELAQMGFVGSQIGRVQQALLEQVLDRPEDNRRTILRRRAEELRKTFGTPAGGGIPLDK